MANDLGKTILVLVSILSWGFSVCLGDPIKSEVLSSEVIGNLGKIVNKLEKSLNQDVDPCEKFYDYVCEEYTNEDKIVPEGSDYGPSVMEYLKQALDLSEAEMKLKNFYQTCVATKDLKKQFREFSLTKLADGWPALNETWSGDNFDWLRLIALIRKYNQVVFIAEMPFKYMDRHDRIDISPVNISYIAELSHDDIIRCREVMLQLDVEESLINNIKDFVSNYTEALNSVNSTGEQTLTYVKFKQMVPEINWDIYFEIVAGRVLEDDYMISVRDLNRLKAILNFLSDVDSKSLANFILFRFIYYARLMKLNKKHEGDCIVDVYRFLPHAFRSFVARKIINDADVQIGISITNQFLKGYKIIKEKYLGDSKFNYLEDTVSRWFEFFANRTEIFSNDKIDEQYAHLKIDPENYFENTLVLSGVEVKNFHDDPNSAYYQQVQKNYNDVIEALFKIHNLPPSVAFSSLGYDLWTRAFSVLLHLDDNSILTTIKCFEEQYSPHTLGSFLSAESARRTLEDYNIFSKEHAEIADAENEVLKNYNLNDKKLFLISIIQKTCPYSHQRIASKAITRHVAGYSKEFNCSENSNLNNEERCVLFEDEIHAN